jgi:tetratricopeptide (TPR) repeat protein
MRHLPPSVVWLNETLAFLENSSAHFRMIYIKGKPLSGKTTLLQQIAIRANENGRVATSVSFPKSIDFFLALQEIATALGLKPTGLDSNSASQLLEEILKICDSSSRLLIIDNLSRVRDGHRLIEAIIRNMSEGSVIASGEVIPEVDPSLALDLLIFRHPGLNFEATVQMVKQSRVKLPHDETSAIKAIYEATSGNPFFIKMLLSPAVLEGRPLEMDEIHRLLPAVRASFYERILNSLEEVNKTPLFLASLIQFDSTLESKILESLPEDVFQYLLEVGLVSLSFSSFSLNSDVRKFLAKLASVHEKELRAKLLTFLSEPQTYFSKKERLAQLVELKRPSEALAAFEELFSDLDRMGDPLHLLLLSDNLVPELSVDALLVRRKALVYLRKPEKALEELQAALKRNFSSKDKLRLFYVTAKTQYYLGEFEEAVKCLDFIVQMSEKDSPIFFQSQIEKAFMLHNRDPRTSILILDMTKYSFQELKINDSSLWGELEFTYGIYFEFLGKLESAADHYQEACRHYKKEGSKSKELLTAFNLFCARFNLGKESSLAALEAIEEECKRHSLDYIIEICAHFRATSLIFEGRFQDGIKLLESYLPKNIKKNLGPTEFRILKKLYIGHYENSNWKAAAATIEQICASEHNAQPVGDENIFPIMRDYLNAYLKVDRSKANQVPVRPKNYLEDIKDTSLKKKMNSIFMAMQLELNLNSFLPVDMISVMAEEAPISEIDSSLLVRLSFLRGIHFFFAGRIKKAEQEFNTSLATAERLSSPYRQFLSLLGLTMIDLNMHQYEFALSKIRKALPLSSAADPHPLQELAKALEAIALLKVGKQREFEKNIMELSPHTPFYYLAYILSPFLLESKPPTAPVIDSIQRKFFDNLLARLDLDIMRTLKLKTHSEERLCYERQLPELSPSDFDIVIHEVNGKWRVGRKWLPLNAQPILESILKFLLIRAGEDISKEELVTQIWQEKYNPLVHDRRIYTAIKRLRDVLKTGLTKSILETRGTFYSIHSRVRFAIIGISTPLDALSERQNWIIKFMETHPNVNRSTIQNLLKISPAYTKLELKSLIDRGLLERLGKGKNSYYRKVSSFK